MPFIVNSSRIALATTTAVAGLATGLSLGLTQSSAADNTPSAPPTAARAAVSGNTVIAVTGNSANGFTLHKLNGQVDHLPTKSEARAECKEYRTKVKRVRCRVGVNRWYSDLGALQETVDFYQRLFD